MRIFPKMPDEVRADSELPVIRIHSDRKWPERVVFDTNRPSIVPAASANTIASAQVPTAAGEASAGRATLSPSCSRLSKSRLS